jgi:hypothetical protein
MHRLHFVTSLCTALFAAASTSYADKVPLPLVPSAVVGIWQGYADGGLEFARLQLNADSTGLLAVSSFAVPRMWITLSAPRGAHRAILLLLSLLSIFGVIMIVRGALMRINDARDLASPAYFGPFGAVFLLIAAPIASRLAAHSSGIRAMKQPFFGPPLMSNVRSLVVVVVACHLGSGAGQVCPAIRLGQLHRARTRCGRQALR